MEHTNDFSRWGGGKILKILQCCTFFLFTNIFTLYLSFKSFQVAQKGSEVYKRGGGALLPMGILVIVQYHWHKNIFLDLSPSPGGYLYSPGGGG